MSDKRLEAQVWVKSGPVVVSDLYSQALLDLRDKIPAASLPDYEIVDSKATKRDGEQGRLYTVRVTYRPLSDHEPSATLDELVVGMQPTTFAPADDDNG